MNNTRDRCPYFDPASINGVDHAFAQNSFRGSCEQADPPPCIFLALVEQYRFSATPASATSHHRTTASPARKRRGQRSIEFVPELSLQAARERQAAALDRPNCTPPGCAAKPTAFERHRIHRWHQRKEKKKNISSSAIFRRPVPYRRLPTRTGPYDGKSRRIAEIEVDVESIAAGLISGVHRVRWRLWPRGMQNSKQAELFLGGKSCAFHLAPVRMPTHPFWQKMHSPASPTPRPYPERGGGDVPRRKCGGLPVFFLSSSGRAGPSEMAHNSEPLYKSQNAQRPARVSWLPDKVRPIQVGRTSPRAPAPPNANRRDF